MEIEISRTLILPFVFYGRETWSLTLRLLVFENMALRRILGLGGTREQGNVETYLMRSLMICTPQSEIHNRFSLSIYSSEHSRKR
jgi:hypothetical protein